MFLSYFSNCETEESLYFPTVKQTISYVHREIQVLLNGTTGNPINVSQGVFNSASLSHMTGISYKLINGHEYGSS